MACQTDEAGLHRLLAGLTPVRDGDFRTRIPEDGDGLLGEIAAVFNGMPEQLSRSPSRGALGVPMVTVHSMGGTGIMTAAVDAARDFPRLRVLAPTVVTSLTDEDLADIGVGRSTDEQVLRLARLAAEAGCHGVIASAPGGGGFAERTRQRCPDRHPWRHAGR